MSVVLCAPAVFRWTAAASGHRHLWAAELLGADTTGVAPVDAGELIAEQLISLMRRVGMPSGLGDVGYGPSDLDALVEATLPQHRVTKLSPRAVERADLERLFASAMRYW
jgi:hydroxyacid-oxoacid transhydrogenase